MSRRDRNHRGNHVVELQSQLSKLADATKSEDIAGCVQIRRRLPYPIRKTLHTCQASGDEFAALTGMEIVLPEHQMVGDYYCARDNIVFTALPGDHHCPDCIEVAELLRARSVELADLVFEFIAVDCPLCGATIPYFWVDQKRFLVHDEAGYPVCHYCGCRFSEHPVAGRLRDRRRLRSTRTHAGRAEKGVMP